MNQQTKTIFAIIILVLLAVAGFYYFGNHKSGSNTPSTETASIKGCYLATLDKDVYVLNIQSENNGAVSGLLAFNNYQKDSSSGTFTGTFNNGILTGNYSFDSEGMHSDRELIFKKVANGFQEGFGPVDVENNKEILRDPANVTYDPSFTFQKSNTCITSTKISEKYFSGNEPVISGQSTVATLARKYINETVDAFRSEANSEVPSMIEKFGAGSPPATYSIDINAKDIKVSRTESIVITVYTYTGGAHGSTTYKVITVDKNGKVLTLSDIIRADKQTAFTDLVKKELNSWRPEGSDASVVFPEEVSALKFSSFSNWSLDDQNLTIYFDQDAIGPGALGAVPFPIPLSKLASYLK
jgi:hypothetical protein